MQIWLDLRERPSVKQVQIVEEAVMSWFMLGRLGAYNSNNLQACLPCPCLCVTAMWSDREAEVGPVMLCASHPACDGKLDTQGHCLLQSTSRRAAALHSMAQQSVCS